MFNTLSAKFFNLIICFRIIPFVAADAVDETFDSKMLNGDPTSFANIVSDKILVTANPIFRYDTQKMSLFSPPIKTEGGFLPKEPPLNVNFYENAYLTTNLVDITSSTSIPAITNPPNRGLLHTNTQWRT